MSERSNLRPAVEICDGKALRRSPRVLNHISDQCIKDGPDPVAPQVHVIPTTGSVFLRTYTIKPKGPGHVDNVGREHGLSFPCVSGVNWHMLGHIVCSELARHWRHLAAFWQECRTILATPWQARGLRMCQTIGEPQAPRSQGARPISPTSPAPWALRL